MEHLPKSRTRLSQLDVNPPTQPRRPDRPPKLSPGLFKTNKKRDVGNEGSLAPHARYTVTGE